MTKEEFVAKLAQAGKITKSQADGIFSAFVDMVAVSIKKGERVALPRTRGLFRGKEEGPDRQESRHRRRDQNPGS
jgi:nucleoid DNA-binding protein